MQCTFRFRAGRWQLAMHTADWISFLLLSFSDAMTTRLRVVTFFLLLCTFRSEIVAVALQGNCSDDFVFSLSSLLSLLS